MSTPERLGAGDPDGSIHGYEATDKISFYGATPVVQRSGSFTALVPATDSTATISTLVNEIRTTLLNLGLHA